MCTGRIVRIITALLVGSTVLLPLAASAAPYSGAVTTGTYSGSWAGSTAQSRVMKFTVNSTNHVTSMTVGYKLSSGGCSVTGSSTLKSISAPITSSKTFTVRKSIASTSFVVKGTMSSAQKAYGTLKVVLTDTTGYGCSGSLRTTWHAKKG